MGMGSVKWITGRDGLAVLSCNCNVYWNPWLEPHKTQFSCWSQLVGTAEPMREDSAVDNNRGKGGERRGGGVKKRRSEGEIDDYGSMTRGYGM
ncbi:hypothetical protein M406DRAFT_355368 [Cryphonectria parasitica EP155]|uniref:Uncharacterized protein n=1 Tax=Cryphonectria parasitica (strain ATCC 38755 / EP155) TaxID=660469 RepID=A0A9P5CR71_CRYP1|nr:uncharacterized protein M406DRAFT_355368 [Cryphonectria parasitica EP155]KAF3766805.1 hypothetical protein M406DRAFT_355368 [Cryphonectria parasitica EP155]